MSTHLVDGVNLLAPEPALDEPKPAVGLTVRQIRYLRKQPLHMLHAVPAPDLGDRVQVIVPELLDAHFVNAAKRFEHVSIHDGCDFEGSVVPNI